MSDTTPEIDPAHEHTHADGTTHAHDHDPGHHDEQAGGAPVEHHDHEHTHADGTTHEHQHGTDHQHS